MWDSQPVSQAGCGDTTTHCRVFAESYGGIENASRWPQPSQQGGASAQSQVWGQMTQMQQNRTQQAWNQARGLQNWDNYAEMQPQVWQQPVQGDASWCAPLTAGCVPMQQQPQPSLQRVSLLPVQGIGYKNHLYSQQCAMEQYGSANTRQMGEAAPSQFPYLPLQQQSRVSQQTQHPTMQYSKSQQWPGAHEIATETHTVDLQDDELDDNSLRSVQELPPAMQPVFKTFKFFNAVQSECFKAVFESDVNMVVAAPTGSGKTGIMELAMLRLFGKQLGPDGRLTKAYGAAKAVYLAPLRALVQERNQDWRQRFSALGISCIELTGDSDYEVKELDSADIICTTPEKFDSVTRRLNEGGGVAFFADIGLVMIDEVHLLGEAERGAALEAGVVSRIKMIGRRSELKGCPISTCRFLAVSATIPNIKDIAIWLDAPIPGGLRVYGEEMRPCKLHTHVRAFNTGKNDFLFERTLNNHVTSIISEYSCGKPTLVFCSSRKGTQECASLIAREAANQGPRNPFSSCYIKDRGQYDRLRSAASKVQAKALSNCLMAGVGFHNAAMEAGDREVVEALFLARDLLVLCCTSTLAQGVNLPCHLVILKGTRRYCGAGPTDGGGPVSSSGSSQYQEYPRTLCLQMIGRAGRPQFDQFGTAVIMTQRENAERYRNLATGAEEVDSVLKASFAEHLLAEIVLQTIQDVGQAIEWLKTTFLWLRMKRAPKKYGLEVRGGDSSLEAQLKETLVLQNVRKLADHGLISTDEDRIELRPAEPGRIMAHHCIQLPTMIRMVQAPAFGGMPQLLSIVARAEELEHIHLRRGEKKVLNDYNHTPSEKGGPKHPLPAANSAKRKERVSSPKEKIFLLLNEVLGDTQCSGFEYSLRQEQDMVVRVAERVAAAMAKLYTHKGVFAATCHALQLSKGLRQRMWADTQQQARQLPHVGRLTAERLAQAGMGTLRSLAAADARRIESVAQRNYPFGSQLKLELARHLPPDLTISLVETCVTAGGAKLDVQLELRRLADVVGGTGIRDGNRGTSAKLMVGSAHNDKLLLIKALSVETFPSPYQFKVICDMPCTASGNPDPNTPPRLVACVLLDRLVGLDVVQNFNPGSATTFVGQEKGEQQVQPMLSDPFDGRPQVPVNEEGGSAGAMGEASGLTESALEPPLEPGAISIIAKDDGNGVGAEGTQRNKRKRRGGEDALEEGKTLLASRLPPQQQGFGSLMQGLPPSLNFGIPAGTNFVAFGTPTALATAGVPAKPLAANAYQAHLQHLPDRRLLRNQYQAAATAALMHQQEPADAASANIDAPEGPEPSINHRSSVRDTSHCLSSRNADNPQTAAAQYVSATCTGAVPAASSFASSGEGEEEGDDAGSRGDTRLGPRLGLPHKTYVARPTAATAHAAAAAMPGLLSLPPGASARPSYVPSMSGMRAASKPLALGGYADYAMAHAGTDAATCSPAATTAVGGRRGGASQGGTALSALQVKMLSGTKHGRADLEALAALERKRASIQGSRVSNATTHLPGYEADALRSHNGASGASVGGEPSAHKQGLHRKAVLAAAAKHDPAMWQQFMPDQACGGAQDQATHPYSQHPTPSSTHQGSPLQLGVRSRWARSAGASTVPASFGANATMGVGPTQLGSSGPGAAGGTKTPVHEARQTLTMPSMPPSAATGGPSKAPAMSATLPFTDAPTTSRQPHGKENVPPGGSLDSKPAPVKPVHTSAQTASSQKPPCVPAPRPAAPAAPPPAQSLDFDDPFSQLLGLCSQAPPSQAPSAPSSSAPAPRVSGYGLAGPGQQGAAGESLFDLFL